MLKTVNNARNRCSTLLLVVLTVSDSLSPTPPILRLLSVLTMANIPVRTMKPGEKCRDLKHPDLSKPHYKHPLGFNRRSPPVSISEPESSILASTVACVVNSLRITDQQLSA